MSNVDAANSKTFRMTFKKLKHHEDVSLVIFTVVSSRIKISCLHIYVYTQAYIRV